MSSVVDPSLDYDLPATTTEEAEACIARYERTHGKLTQQVAKPTTAQVTGVLTLLKAQRAPFVDFKLFTPWGKSTQDQMRMLGWVQNGPTWQQAQMSGPANFETWEPCYRVWRNAMLMADASRVGALDAYGDYIRSRCAQFPKWWSVIHKADHDMRSHQWAQHRAGIQAQVAAGTYRGEHGPARPWESVIVDSIPSDETHSSSTAGAW